MVGSSRRNSGQRGILSTPRNDTSSTGIDSTRRRSDRLGLSRVAQPARYLKTPASRHIKRHTQLRTPVSANENADNLSGLLKKTWKVYEVSPLYNFCHESPALTAYSKALSRHIKTKQQCGTAFSTEDVADDVTMSPLPGLKMQQTDSEAIVISLKKQKKTSADIIWVDLLTVMLCGVDVTAAVSISGQFTLLPLLLVKGPVHLSKLVLQWIQCQFDCRIDPMTFSHLDLSWLLAISAGFLKEQRPKPVVLVYKVPGKGTNDLSMITIDINASDCQQLWQSIHAEESDVVDQREVAAFLGNIEDHFYHHFAIKLSAMPLKRIGTSTVYASVDGRIKLFCEKHVRQILSYMTEMVQEQWLCNSQTDIVVM